MRVRAKELRRTRKRAEDRHKERHPAPVVAAKPATATAAASPRRK